MERNRKRSSFCGERENDKENEERIGEEKNVSRGEKTETRAATAQKRKKGKEVRRQRKAMERLEEEKQHRALKIQQDRNWNVCDAAKKKGANAKKTEAEC